MRVRFRLSDLVPAELSVETVQGGGSKCDNLTVVERSDRRSDYKA